MGRTDCLFPGRRRLGKVKAPTQALIAWKWHSLLFSPLCCASAPSWGHKYPTPTSADPVTPGQEIFSPPPASPLATLDVGIPSLTSPPVFYSAASLPGSSGASFLVLSLTRMTLAQTYHSTAKTALAAYPIPGPVAINQIWPTLPPKYFWNPTPAPSSFLMLRASSGVTSALCSSAFYSLLLLLFLLPLSPPPKLENIGKNLTFQELNIQLCIILISSPPFLFFFF